MLNLSPVERKERRRKQKRDSYYRHREKVLFRCSVNQKKKTCNRPIYCEACGQPNTKNRALCYDHDHNTGKFRGWLCHACNSALGLVKDNPAILVRLANYLENQQLTNPIMGSV